METLEVAAEYRAVVERFGLTTCGHFERYFLKDAVVRQTQVFVNPGTLPGNTGAPREVFYKQYEYSQPAWQFLGRASKARREYDNYAAFARMGVACAEPIAVGEERDRWGRLRRAFILTKAVRGAKTLVEFFQLARLREPGAEVKALRRALLGQLAAMTRRVHDAGFCHNDLVWRNILVADADSGMPSLWWIDCPRGRFRRWCQRRGRIKDLASLDKSAAKFCTRGERITFLKHYLAKERLDADAKRWIREVLSYRQRRWPDDWT